MSEFGSEEASNLEVAKLRTGEGGELQSRGDPTEKARD